jgi:hypothetical protein
MLDHEDHGLMAQFEVVRTSHNATTGSAAQAAVVARELRRTTLPATHLWGLTVQTPHLSSAWPGGYGLSAAKLKSMMCGPDKKKARLRAKVRRA